MKNVIEFERRGSGPFLPGDGFWPEEFSSEESDISTFFQCICLKYQENGAVFLPFGATLAGTVDFPLVILFCEASKTSGRAETVQFDPSVYALKPSVPDFQQEIPGQFGQSQKLRTDF